MKPLQRFVKNILDLPFTFQKSFIRHDKPTSDRARSQIVFSNFFLHGIATRTHRYSLKPTFTFFLGIISMSAFFILTLTGIILMIYYKPSTELAYDSIKDIVFIVPGGNFIRNVHRWATNVMIVAVFMHMARVFYTAAYKKSRAFNWVIGIVLLALTLMMSFTGYLLPWDQLAYWAIVIATNIGASFNELTDAVNITQFVNLGAFMKIILLGSLDIGQDALTRFYWLHCIVLPLVLVIFIGVHMWRVRKDGGLVRPNNLTDKDLKGTPIDTDAESAFTKNPQKTYSLMCVVKGSTPNVNDAPEQTVLSWPYLFPRIAVMFMFTFAIICVYAHFVDAPLKELANPSVPENPAKAPWYFLGLQELVSYSAFMGGVGIPSIALLGLALIPYLDREEHELGRWFDNKQGATVALISFIFSAVAVIAMLAFTVKFGWLRNWYPKIPQLVITFVNPGTILVGFFVAWSIICLLKFKSTRMAAISLFTCFLVGFVILTYFGTVHRGPNWEFYWSSADWPVHH